MFTKVIALLSLIASLYSGTPVEDHEIYMRGMQIYSIDYLMEDTYNFSCIDSVGFTWSFTGTYEDFYEGDIVCCLMDTMGTPLIFDDAILMINYSGYSLDNIPSPQNYSNPLLDELLTDGTEEID